MALPIGTLTFHSPLYPRSAGYHPMTITYGKVTQVCRMHVRSYDKVSLENKRSSEQEQDLLGNKPRWLRLRWPIGIQHARIHCTTQRHTYQEKIWSCNCLRWPCKPTQLHPSSRTNLFRWNRPGQMSLRSLRSIAQCNSQTLPCRQRTLCRQCISQVNCRIRTKNKFLWRQCSFPEWDCWETNLRSIRASKETTPTHKGKVAISNQNKSLAICTTLCKWHSQHNSRQGRRELTSREILQVQHLTKAS
jgi:hypothetical protein